MLLCLRRGVLARAGHLAERAGTARRNLSSVSRLSSLSTAMQTPRLAQCVARRVCASFKAQAKGAYRTPRIRFERLAAEV